MHQVSEMPARSVPWPFRRVADRQQAHGTRAFRHAGNFGDTVRVERANPARNEPESRGRDLCVVNGMHVSSLLGRVRRSAVVRSTRYAAA
jgi:hypothetical protein